MTSRIQEIEYRLNAADPTLCQGTIPNGQCDYFGESLICLADTYETYQDDVALFWNAPSDLRYLLDELKKKDEALSKIKEHKACSRDGCTCTSRMASEALTAIREVEGK